MSVKFVEETEKVKRESGEVVEITRILCEKTISNVEAKDSMFSAPATEEDKLKHKKEWQAFVDSKSEPKAPVVVQETAIHKAKKGTK
jgi:hypothetical protein